MPARHKWESRLGGDRCARCHLYRKPNPLVKSRPLYSRDNGTRWEPTEYGYVPPCISTPEALLKGL